MAAVDEPMCKVYSIMRMSLSSASGSPGSCASGSSRSSSSGGSLSSDCLSLSCSEAEYLAAELQEVEGPCAQEELCGSCQGSSGRFDGSQLEARLPPSELCRLIRDDLQKQREAAQCARTTPAPAQAMDARAAPAVRRLPAQHRGLIVGWMRQVTTALRLQLSTLFSATAMLDRFVAAAEALPGDGLLQLLALTCMSVAVKYNEVGQVAPAVWLSLAVDPMGRRLYTTRDLQRYEFTVLQTIGWRLHDPTAFTFLEHFLLCLSHGSGSPHMTYEESLQQQPATGAVPGAVAVGPVGSRAAMLAELTLMYDNFVSYDASAVALACVTLAERAAAMSGELGAAAGRQSAAASPLLLPAQLAVAATAGLKLEQIAQGFESCVDALDKCFVLYCQQQQQQPAAVQA